MDIFTGVYLLIEGLRDFRTKEISLWGSLGVGLVGLLYSISVGRAWTSIILAEIPGIICLLISFCTRQSVGYGDGILLCSLGMLYTFEDLLIICTIAIGFAGLMGLVLLVVFRKSGKYEIPFVPFLFIGWFLFYGTRLVNGGSA